MKSRVVLGMLCGYLFLVCCTSDVNINQTNTDQNGSSNSRQRSEKLDRLFDSGGLGEMTLTVSEEEWNKLLTNFDKNSRNSTYVTGGFQFQKGTSNYVIDNVGVRIRGNTTRQRPEGSKGQLHNSSSPQYRQTSFKVKFTANVDDDAHHLEKAMKGVNLKYMVNDASYVQEVYSYDLFRRFGVWTAPRAAYTKLYIKVGKEDPAYFGIYKMIEEINKQFLKARVDASGGKFRGDSGNLWKCLYQGGPADLKNESLDSKIGIETDERTPTYDLKTNEETGLSAAKAELTAFISELNGQSSDRFPSWIASKMDVDLFLRILAVDTVVGMWDGYWVNANNYYLYFDAGGKVYFIPYDYDNTLGVSNSGLMQDPTGKKPLEWGPSSGRPLANRILAVPEYKAKYQNYLKELVNETAGIANYENSKKRIDEWHALIEPHADGYDADTECSKDGSTIKWSLRKDCPEAGINLLQYNTANYFVRKAKSINSEFYSDVEAPVIDTKLLGYSINGGNITFTFDPAMYENVPASISSVLIWGSFNSWNTGDSSYSLSKDEEGGIWSGTFSKPASRRRIQVWSRWKVGRGRRAKERVSGSGRLQ